MFQNLKVHKAKIKPNGTLGPIFEYTDDKGVSHISNDTSTAIIHDDLREAFNALSPHVHKLCGFGGDPTDIDVSSISFKKTDKKEGVVLTCKRRCGKRVLNFNSYFIDTEHEEYEALAQLCELIEACRTEVIEYVLGNKVGIGSAKLEPVEDEV